MDRIAFLDETSTKEERVLKTRKRTEESGGVEKKRKVRGAEAAIVRLWNLPFECNEKDVEDLLVHREIEFEKIELDKFGDSGRCRGSALIHLKSKKKSRDAMKMLNFRKIRGRTVKAEIVKGIAQIRKVFVKNLPYTVTEEEVRRVLDPSGAIESIRIPLDGESGQSRGFAYVLFKTSAGAQDAVSRSGCVIGGRNAFIDLQTQDSDA